MKVPTIVRRGLVVSSPCNTVCYRIIMIGIF